MIYDLVLIPDTFTHQLNAMLLYYGVRIAGVPIDERKLPRNVAK